MKKAIGILVTLIIAVLIALVAWFWPLFEIGFDGSAHYTEQDARRYELLTHDLLKEIPRISPRYKFDFANVSGPQAFFWTITFYDTEQTSRIEAWLISQGYEKKCCLLLMCL